MLSFLSLGVLPLSVSRAIVHPSVAVTVEAAGPALAVAVSTRDTTRSAAPVAGFCAGSIRYLDRSSAS